MANNSIRDHQQNISSLSQAQQNQLYDSSLLNVSSSSANTSASTMNTNNNSNNNINQLITNASGDRLAFYDFSDQELMSSDNKYKQYALAIDKALKSFEYTSEWADLVNALGKLNRVILVYD